ncbi:LppX_LprAFG lipoprotein [Phytoactinopolyspora alkaliphila]|uniref:LppX_LprAFG lipoprotein n=1 Tax=Phytoactinopolyspora alkaliphila TaxID=1783498 RepID=A0A6N9YR65_9ACTN|nr:LppX_LprAFG lipoprotein [Phytoactinopolyspora alkaliphila]NED97551.1 LppX_LprAFG lipoprotein [Phytoactinopolyspora alkaliphila]
MRRSLTKVRALLVVATVLAAAGCSDDGGSGSDEDPQAQLDAAGERLDSSSSVRFTVEGDNLPGSGTVVVGAEGVAVPPASFDGGVRIRAGAIPATIDVVSIDGQLWAQLPMTDGYEPIDASDLDFGDPGKLIDPDEGVSLLLRSGTEVTAADRIRLDGEVYNQVHSTLPGELVDTILAIADPSAAVSATWALHPDTGELRQATLTGPFYEGGEQTYTVHLDQYDEPAEISAPTG